MPARTDELLISICALRFGNRITTQEDMASTEMSVKCWQDAHDQQLEHSVHAVQDCNQFGQECNVVPRRQHVLLMSTLASCIASLPRIAGESQNQPFCADAGLLQVFVAISNS